ncbi:MAG: hypothetical protein JM58_14520 [Peptococcaceae bacterium BICA1-8]|nr:MAG: hypothetical protein JM58_14520 [Peptococcaceae bacterium BICA1-8]
MKQELEYFSTTSVISEENKDNILANYEVKSTSGNFIKIILTLGALLLGLGILSFIASNWQYLGKLSKFTILLGIYLIANLGSYKLSQDFPKTSISLIYLGVLTYGAAIFLIDQMFNFSGHFTSDFLLWGLGILPMGVIFKDKLIFIFTHILFLVYLNGNFDIDGLPLIMLIVSPALYYLNTVLGNSKLGSFFNNLVGLNTLGYFAHYWGLDGFYICVMFLLFGVLMYVKPLGMNKEIMKVQGNIVIGISGLILTFKDTWDIVPFDSRIMTSLVFTLIFLLFLFNTVRKGSLISLVFICFTIFRFYFDTFYDFMPKSIFFIIGGVILLGFGYYFEKLRKKGVTIGA